MQKHLDKHFKSEGYTEFFHVTLIDKIDGSNPTKRERERESYWMRTLKIFAAYSLNFVNSIWLVTGTSDEKRFFPLIGITRVWILIRITTLNLDKI